MSDTRTKKRVVFFFFLSSGKKVDRQLNESVFELKSVDNVTGVTLTVLMDLF